MLTIFTLLLLGSPADRAGDGAPSQDWFSGPVLPAVLDDEASEPSAPPLGRFARRPDPQASPESGLAETSAYRGVSAEDIRIWREDDELRRVRETFGDVFFGIPSFIPQLLIEGLAPRGIPIGPTTYLYRTAAPGATLALVVFDQMLFHEAQFAERVRAEADSGLPPNLRDGQRHVLRKSFMNGIRATYALPPLSLSQAADAANEEGILGYVAAPAIVGAVLYLQGIDQKIRLHDDVSARVKLASGRQWMRGLQGSEGTPVLSVELRFCDFPVGLLVSCDVSSRGLVPAFVGVGTSLDVVEDVLGLETARATGARPR